MRKILFTLVVLQIVIAASAQESGNINLLKQANAEYAHLRYAYAIPLYKNYLASNATDAAATLQLAKCYQINNQYDSAIKYTKLAISLGASTSNMLAELLANKKDYVGASNAYLSIDSKTAKSRQNGFKDVSIFSIDSLNYTLKFLSINTPFNEFSALPHNDGLVFESNRAEKIKGTNEFGWDGSAYSKLYFTSNKQTVSLSDAIVSNWNEKTLSVSSADINAETSNDVDKIQTKLFDFKAVTFNGAGVQYFDEGLNSKFNVGAICFSSDNKTAYFTKNQQGNNNLLKSSDNQSHLLEIWSANFESGKWTNFKKLEFNKSNASYFHPALSKNNNRLFFISDEQGGQGGTDLYYVEKDAQGNWGAPVNAGDKVNTAGNELYPTVSGDELYISSNGHAGLGGLDIYKVILQNDKVTGVENVGYPVNSSTDDMSFTKNGNEGYFVSNRFGSDDIFAFEFAVKKIRLVGKVLSSDGSKQAITVKLYSVNPNTLIETATVDANGAYSFLVLPNRPYYVEAVDPKGNQASLNTNSKGYVLAGTNYEKNTGDLTINIPPPPPVEPTKPTIKNIIDSLIAVSKNYVQFHHNFDKVSLVKSEWKSYNNFLATVKKFKNEKIVILSAADCFGTDEYNENLSTRRVEAIGYQVLKANRRNSISKMHVGERILQEPCDQNASKDQQYINRYTFVFILK